MNEIKLNNQAEGAANTTSVETPYLQLMLRKALLEKAAPETINKFTGAGNGATCILREDAEDIVATSMEVIAAKRSNTEIIVDGTRFRADQYPAFGEGLAQLMNWSGLAYFDTTVDNEREQRAIVTREQVTYVKDSYMKTVVGGKEIEVFAGGKVVTPEKLETLLKGFNGLNKKVNAPEIKTGEKVSKSDLNFHDFNYLYVDGIIRQVGTRNDAKGCEFATLLQPTVKFSGLEIGKVSEEEPNKNVEQWLL